MKEVNKIERSQVSGGECNEYSQKHLHNYSLVMCRRLARVTGPLD